MVFQTGCGFAVKTQRFTHLGVAVGAGATVVVVIGAGVAVVVDGADEVGRELIDRLCDISRIIFWLSSVGGILRQSSSI